MIPSALRIRLLGGFGAWVGESPVLPGAWRLRKAKSLLKLLALAPERRMHRDRAGDLLWPERDTESVANNLHQAMYVARRALDSAMAGAGSCLAIDDQSLWLGAGRAVEVDVDAFEAAAARARRTQTLEAYLAAVRLYGGELLPEDLGEPWSDVRRRALREQRVNLLLELADVHAREGRLTQAMETVQQAVTEEPLHEGAHRALMKLFATDGRRQQALAQYQQLHHLLRRELEAKPDLETRRLYRELLVELGPPVLPEGSPAPSEESDARGNLPLQLTSFIGRERERAEVKRLLARTRLVTLTGSGGCGKTRLALEAARAQMSEFEDGVWQVELAPISDPALVVQQAATAFGMKLQSDRDGADALAGQIGPRRLLLVLDNCEHLIAASARLVERLLRSCPRLRVLTTSREPLRVPGEVVFRVPSLSLPSVEQTLDLEGLAGTEAVRLFVERAAETSQGFRLDRENAGLRRKHRDVRGVGMSLGNLALLEARAGYFGRARALLSSVLEGFGRTDDSPGAAAMHMNLGNVELAAGEWGEGRKALEIGGVTMTGQLLERGAVWAWVTLAEGALDHDEPEEAARYIAEANRCLLPIGDQRAAARLDQLVMKNSPR